MTKKEQRAVREWVKDGRSVYENPSGAWYDGQVPVEFLSIYRDEEYIRQHTKGMNLKMQEGLRWNTMVGLMKKNYLYNAKKQIWDFIFR